MRHYYTVKQVQEMLQISRTKVYELVNMEGFPIVRVGKMIRIPDDGLQDWLKHQSAS